MNPATRFDPSPPSSSQLIWRLILKDFYFQRWIAAGSLLAGLIALGLILTGSDIGFYSGLVLMMTSLIALGAVSVILTVVDEHKDGNAAFVMSLPVSPHQDAAAKILANLLIFGSAWFPLMAAMLGLILSDALPDGLVIYTLIIFTQIAVNTCLVLAVAMVTRSLPLSIGVMLICNLFYNIFLFWVVNLPSYSETSESSGVAWPADAVSVLGVELLAIALLLSVAHVVTSRRKDFL
ncbi:MAG: hypothetical protein AAF560_33875 [Acidobacteriota bacterium]